MAIKRKKKAPARKPAARRPAAKKEGAKSAKGRKQMIGKAIPGLPLSQGWRAGDFVYTSGQLPWDESGRLVAGDIEAQTRTVLRCVERVLKGGGASLADVVKVTTFITDRSLVPAYNRVYAEFFPSNPPARSTVVTGLVADALIEIEAVAYKPL
jgi:reactive intermediate/imine deaminase